MLAVTAPRVARALLGSVLLGAPFVLAAHAAEALVAPLTRATVGTLVRVTAPLNVVAVATPEVAPVVAVPPKLTFDAATKSQARRASKPLPKAKPAALFVSQATVLALAQSVARPTGSFVGQTAEHPAGLRLSGVAALGIGVQDGDILIEALGITPRAPGQIIAAVIEARAKQARFLSGKLWREGQTFPITVEQPYLDSAIRTSAAPASRVSGDRASTVAPRLGGIREGSPLASERALF